LAPAEWKPSYKFGVAVFPPIDPKIFFHLGGERDGEQGKNAAQPNFDQWAILRFSAPPPFRGNQRLRPC